MASAQAASIEFVGIESGATVQNWSNPNPLFDEMMVDLNDKEWDLNGDNRFGGAGYYQIMPAVLEEIGDNTVVLPAIPGNDLGVLLDISGANQGILKTAAWTPQFLSAIPVGAAGEFINTPDFPNYSDSSGNGQLRQGSIWLSDPQNQGTMPGGAPGYWSAAFSFTLSEVAGFRLGVAVDAMSFDGSAPHYVSIQKVGTNDVFSSLLDRDGLSDMVFFDVHGDAGNEFLVKLWRADANRTAFALITFDQAPTPTLTYTQDGTNIILSWEQNIPGWILESSTDLGKNDQWDPLSDENNDNSVTVPMTGVPRNFFRLRKDP